MSNSNSKSDIVLPVGWTPASVLMNSTGDAMSNIYDIIIDWPWDAGTATGTIFKNAAEAAVSYRAEGFSIPEAKSKTYDVYWRGVKVKKVASGIDMDRKFDITFRLDANYALYQKFTAWKKIVGDVNTSGVANTASALGRIQIVAPGAEYNSMSWSTPSSANDEANMVVNALGSTNLVWTFEDVQAVDVETPKFKNEATGNAMKYKVTFIFGDMAAPFFTTANAVSHNHRA